MGFAAFYLIIDRGNRSFKPANRKGRTRELSKERDFFQRIPVSIFMCTPDKWPRPPAEPGRTGLT
jgi:hypothetical protein